MPVRDSRWPALSDDGSPATVLPPWAPSSGPSIAFLVCIVPWQLAVHHLHSAEPGKTDSPSSAKLLPILPRLSVKMPYMPGVCGDVVTRILSSRLYGPLTSDIDDGG